MGNFKIDHVAIWAEDLELLREFYAKYFGGVSGPLNHNPAKGFTSYFISFDGGCRLELMHREGMTKGKDNQLGYAHISFSVGSKEKVNELTERIRNAGFSILGEPRTTGDGYYESVIADPEGNIIEITE